MARVFNLLKNESRRFRMSLAAVKPVALIRSIFLAKLHDSPETGKDGECFGNPKNFRLLQSRTKWFETLFKKDHFVERLSFLIFNVVTTWRCLLSVFQHWKGGEGGLAFLAFLKAFGLLECINTFVLDWRFISIFIFHCRCNLVTTHRGWFSRPF